MAPNCLVPNQHFSKVPGCISAILATYPTRGTTRPCKQTGLLNGFFTLPMHLLLLCCIFGLPPTGRIGSRQQLAGSRRALGVFWRCPAVSWGPSTPNPTQISWKTLILKNWLIFPASCGYVVVLPHVAQVRFWRPKMPHSE